MTDFDTLELSTETLRELSRDELGEVAGGSAQPTWTPLTVALAGYVLQQATQLSGQLESRACA